MLVGRHQYNHHTPITFLHLRTAYILFVQLSAPHGAGKCYATSPMLLRPPETLNEECTMYYRDVTDDFADTT